MHIYMCVYVLICRRLKASESQTIYKKEYSEVSVFSPPLLPQPNMTVY